MGEGSPQLSWPSWWGSDRCSSFVKSIEIQYQCSFWVIPQKVPMMHVFSHPEKKIKCNKYHLSGGFYPAVDDVPGGVVDVIWDIHWYSQLFDHCWVFPFV